MDYKKHVNKRTVAFGANAALIVIVGIALLGVINFLGNRYPKKLDLTKNKLHTFSEQSEKVVKELKNDLTFTVYGDAGSKERFRILMDQYKKLNPKVAVEYVDPNKEVTRAKSAGIKKMDTLILGYQGRTSKVEEITEEKVTNAIIKMTKDTKLTVCFVTGHGEPSITSEGPEGLSSLKKGLEAQSYEVKEISLPQELKIPAECSGVVSLASKSAFFPAEVKAFNEYLSNGGRVVIGVDASIGSQDATSEIRNLIASYGVEIKGGLVIDPVSKMLGVDASVPVIAEFNESHPLGKDFREKGFFPFSRPMDISKKTPEGLTATWVGRTTIKAWGETDLAAISKGQVDFNPSSDVPGPLAAIVAVTGKMKDSKANKDLRLVVFSSGQFASNNYGRFGGNLDLALNSIAYVLEDESMITIRAKEDEAGQIELSQTQGLVLFWGVVIGLPILIAASGIVIWIRRKKL